MSHWDSGLPADGQHDVPRPSWPDGLTYPFPLPQAAGADDGGPDGDDRTAPYPLTYERDEFFASSAPPAAPPRESYHPWPPAPYPAFLRNAARDPGEQADSGGGRAPRGRGWLVLAGIVVVAATVGAGAVLLQGGHSAARGPGDL